MLSREKKDERSNFSALIVQEVKLFHSKVVYSLYGNHEHFFCKSELMNSGIDSRCKVCGILISEYRAQRKLESKNAPVLYENYKKGKSSDSILEILLS